MSFSHADGPTTLISQTADHIYLDLLITNRNTSSVEPVQITYNQQRIAPFLYNPQGYLFSITRFSLDTVSLPVMIPTVDLTEQGNITITQGLPQPTIYSTTLSYTDITSGITIFSERTSINWTPEIISSPLPNNDMITSSQDLSGTYYYVMNYTYWINLCNDALARAFRSLQDAATDNLITLPVDEPPFIIWNTDLQLISLCGLIGTEDTGGYLTFVNQTLNTHTKYSSISIFFNSALYALFNSLPSIIYDYGKDVNINGVIIPGANVQIIMNYQAQNIINIAPNPFDLTTTNTYIQTFQEFSTISIWNPVVSIVFQ